MLDTSDFITRLKQSGFYKGQIVHTQNIPPRAARFGDLEYPLPSVLQRVLTLHRLGPLYTHQTQAINLIRAGQNVMVATSSASGKSMCYNLPVMQTMLEECRACAIYLFPTKALAQDQLGKINHLFSPDVLRTEEYNTFDGDTPGQSRSDIRCYARLILTNPDMLHVSMLPHHKAWARFWRNLRYVVLDEAHAYRGVFGSHVALVLRRLRRICAVYGSSPQFILCSATIDNPKEHAINLTGLPFSVVTDDGSPKGGKDFIFWNPPLLDPITGVRRSANAEAADLSVKLVSESIRSICFVRTRRLSELIANYIRKRLSDNAPAYVSRIGAYRAGYLADERRKIEQGLAYGALMCVVATNALELGVDIGDLDATILVGYPGTISSTWQQAGRSGRRDTHSLSFFIGLDNPLDQYLMRQPEFFFEHGFESALLNTANHYIVRAHLLCAAWEMALIPSDVQYFGNTMHAEMQGLLQEGFLKARRGHVFLSTALSYPAGDVNIRAASGDNFSLIDMRNGRLIETLELFHAFTQAHLGAIYLHQGESYKVTEFDLEGKIIKAEPSEATYYTVAKDLTDVRILSTQKENCFGDVSVYLGEVDVSMKIVSFKKKRQFTDEVLGEESLILPTRRFSTVALWFDLPHEAEKYVAKEGMDFMGGIHGLEHAAIGMLPLFAMCDRNDIGGLSTPQHQDTGKAQIFIYDAFPNGVGIAEKGFEIICELWQATLAAITGCACHDGCPSCIQSPKCGNNNKPLDKQAARVLLKGLLKAAKPA